MTARKLRPLLVVAAVALAIGLVLRVVLPDVIMFLHDEAWTLDHVNAAREGGAWAPLGMPSSRGVKNAGMSVWVFIVLGLVSGATTPEGLTRAVAVLGLAAQALLLVVPLRLVDPTREDERRAWMWAAIMGCTNPVLVFLERKIWAQSVLPIFGVALVIAYFKRETKVGGFVWGLVGAVVGQIHMAGFFFVPALAIWTRLFEGRSRPPGRRTSWIAWFAGSIAGALPAIGWVLYLARERPGANSSNPLLRFRLEFYQYFFSDPTGLCSTYVVGDDLWPAMKWPRIGGTPTYLVGIAHVALAIATLAIAIGLLRWIAARRESRTPREWLREVFVGDATDTRLLLGAVVVAMGILMTLPSIPIHRHYMLAIWPLPYVFFALAALKRPRGERWLGVLVAGGFFVTVGLLAFLHDNGGASGFGMTLTTARTRGASFDEAKVWSPRSTSAP